MTTTTTTKTKLLESCRIPPVAAGEPRVLPLSFLDMMWLHSDPICRVLFYEHGANSSEAYFLETLVPKLKQSLSLTLKHYPPVAANLVFSDQDTRPFIRYVPGDSVSLNIALSSRDFGELVANDARDCDQFYDFVPEIRALKQDELDQCSKTSSVNVIVPLMALQVTLFPGRGICIGFSNHHTLGDARSIVGFISAWASINQFGGERSSSDDMPPPIFDKSVINDPNGIDAIYWKTMREIPFNFSSFRLPTNRVRATYTLHQADIKKLKDSVSAKISNKPGLVQYLSTFVVTASYVWTCFLKSGDAVGEQVDNDMLEFFFFAVDLRGGRTDPPVPANYFGNCLSHGMALAKHRELVAEEGYVIAAEGVAENIKNKVSNKDEVLKCAENWAADGQKYKGRLRMFGVSGSPKFDLSGADFGWGRTRKVEVVSIDGDEYSMSLCKCNDSQGGLEFGLSLPKERMEAFAAIFEHGLIILT